MLLSSSSSSSSSSLSLCGERSVYNCIRCVLYTSLISVTACMSCVYDAHTCVCCCRCVYANCAHIYTTCGTHNSCSISHCVAVYDDAELSVKHAACACACACAGACVCVKSAVCGLCSNSNNTHTRSSTFPSTSYSNCFVSPTVSNVNESV